MLADFAVSQHQASFSVVTTYTSSLKGACLPCGLHCAMLPYLRLAWLSSLPLAGNELLYGSSVEMTLNMAGTLWGMWCSLVKRSMADRLGTRVLGIKTAPIKCNADALQKVTASSHSKCWSSCTTSLLKQSLSLFCHILQLYGAFL